MAVVDALTEIVAELEGGGTHDYYKAMGREAFEDLRERDAFRSFLETARNFSQLQGESLVKLAGLVYNFGEWSYHGQSPTRFVVEVRDATALAPFREWTATGFIEELFAFISSERIEEPPDETRFT